MKYLAWEGNRKWNSSICLKTHTVSYPTKVCKRKSSQWTWSVAGKWIGFLPLHLDTGLLQAILSSSMTASTSQSTPWIIEIIVILIFWSFWFLVHTFKTFLLFHGNNELIYSKQCLPCNRCSKSQQLFLPPAITLFWKWICDWIVVICVLFSSFVSNHHETKLCLWLLFICMQKLSKFLYFVSIKTHVIATITIFVGLAFLAGYNNIIHTYSTYSHKKQMLPKPTECLNAHIFPNFSWGANEDARPAFSALCYGENTWIVYLVLTVHLITPVEFHGRQTKISFCLGT